MRATMRRARRGFRPSSGMSSFSLTPLLAHDTRRKIFMWVATTASPTSAKACCLGTVHSTARCNPAAERVDVRYAWAPSASRQDRATGPRPSDALNWIGRLSKRPRLGHRRVRVHRGGRRWASAARPASTQGLIGRHPPRPSSPPSLDIAGLVLDLVVQRVRPFVVVPTAALVSSRCHACRGRGICRLGPSA